MREYFELFAVFFRIGAFTFGGGLAMLSVIQREIAENKKWATEKELLDCFAIAQCTPGVIAVNTATFIGYKRKKSVGSCGGNARSCAAVACNNNDYCRISEELFEIQNCGSYVCRYKNLYCCTDY